MTKEFEIKDILNAVNSISKIEIKSKNATKENFSAKNGYTVAVSKPVKSIESKILVLDQMIE